MSEGTEDREQTEGQTDLPDPAAVPCGILSGARGFFRGGAVDDAGQFGGITEDGERDVEGGPAVPEGGGPGLSGGLGVGGDEVERVEVKMGVGLGAVGGGHNPVPERDQEAAGGVEPLAYEGDDEDPHGSILLLRPVHARATQETVRRRWMQAVEDDGDGLVLPVDVIEEGGEEGAGDGAGALAVAHGESLGQLGSEHAERSVLFLQGTQPFFGGGTGLAERGEKDLLLVAEMVAQQADELIRRGFHRLVQFLPEAIVGAQPEVADQRGERLGEGAVVGGGVIPAPFLGVFVCP